ncbi:MAG: hypothetical protein AB7T14_04355 [Candidatus Methylacidiphilaceae bacterium]
MVPHARTIPHLNWVPPAVRRAILAAVEGMETVASPDLDVSQVLGCGGLAVLRKKEWEWLGL